VTPTLAWRTPLAALVAVRLAIPLAALAASGHDLRLIPRYDYVPLTGDATGFYAAAREFLASWGELGAPVVAALAAATVSAAALLLHAWRRRTIGRHWLVALCGLAFALVVTAAIAKMHPSGAAVFGWPLVWSLPMLPYRALGLPLDPDIAFGFGVAISLLANAVTVVATAYVGLYATGRRAIGLGAAALYAFWPLLVGLVGGSRAWENGTWTVDAGLALYTEPLSTALVATAAAVLLSPRLTDLRLATSGVLLGLATAVKLSNGVFAAALLVLVARRLGARRALPYLVSALSLAPLVAAYWPMGYSAQFDTPSERHPFSADYVVRNWTDSLLFTPDTLLVLLPPAIVGAIALRAWWARRVLVVWALVNPVFYSFFEATPEHPRFMFASLPAVLVLWVAGLATVAAAGANVLRRRRLEPAPP
jgi:hypothetical protein